ncbi:MAG: NAD-dependent epimerase/dehydratase family protein [Planctomycetota bacterium]
MKFPAAPFDAIKAMAGGGVTCVTGGAGFIGGHVVNTLIAAGASVRVIDDLSNSSLDAIADDIELHTDRLRFVYGSILDERALDESIAGAETVIHLAAMGSVPRSLEEPERAAAVNTTGTLRVLEAARRHGVRRVVFAGSSSAYGNPERLPCDEMFATQPLSPYAASKLAAEEFCRAWSASYGLSTVCLRYFNVFGPRQRADSAYAAVVAAFAGRLLAGKHPMIFGDGEQSRDFTFVANAVYATCLAAFSDTKLDGQAINVGTGSSCTVNELAARMAARLAPGAPPAEHRDPRTGDVRDSLASIERAASLLGYQPIVGLDEGLDQTCDWFVQTHAPAEERRP